MSRAYDDVTPYTAEERQPFTTDPRAVAAIDNIFCLGELATLVAEPGFVGWIVQGQRPLSCVTGFTNAPDGGVLGYGNAGTIFSTYNEAVAACIRSWDYAQKMGYTEWFKRKHRIFSVKHPVSRGNSTSSDKVSEKDRYGA